MRSAAMLLALLLTAQAARAGAWTQDAGSWQAIGSIIASTAARSFDDSGAPGIPDASRRLLLQSYLQYGWRDGVTFYAQTETVYARAMTAGAMQPAIDNGAGGGVRLRLYHDDDGNVFSAELGGFFAGAYNFTGSASSDDPGRDAELRLLYGRGFRWREMDGFADIELGHRWMNAPRPDEMPLDLTAGLWLDAGTMAMLQSFNLFSAGPARPPYAAFRSHKLELSLVRRLTPAFEVQAGAFFSPAGRNALDEDGLCLGLWSSF